MYAVKLWLWLPVAILYLLAAGLCVFVVREANASAAASYTLNQRLELKENATTKLKTLFGRASFGLYKGGEEESAELEAVVESYDTHRHNSRLASWGLAGTALLILILAYFQGANGLQNATPGHLLAISLLLLPIGLLTPIFSLVVSQNVPVLEQVVLKQDSKGVLDTILALFRANQLFVGTLLLVFSVVTPILKTALTFLVLSGGDKRGRIARFVKSLGKWSMADVFVVALFLVMLSLGSDGLTDARLGIGLYYFAAYVLLSLLATQIMTVPESRQRAQEIKAHPS